MSDLLQRLHGALAGRYTIARELGRGGMATVFLAHDVRHERAVPAYKWARRAREKLAQLAGGP